MARIHQDRNETYQDNTTRPNVHLATSVQRVRHNKLGRRITRTSTARLHQIASSPSTWQNLIQSHALNIISRSESRLNLLRQLIRWVECVRESEIRDYYVAIAVQEQVLELQVSVNNALLMQIPYTRYELRK